MAKLKLVYDEDGDIPQAMAISFRAGKMQWDKQSLYINILSPVKKHSFDEFGDLPVYSVFLEDLTVNALRPNCFGIDVNSVRSRYSISESTNTDPIHLVVRLTDVEDVLLIDLRTHFYWEVAAQ
ncbi:hypothetical protein [Paenibacillus sp. HJGM_3]|uniref:hypothetical protein n=1 Tax=Paenibacillus sp. HJGM_3 TaxID=3379816 RepID=UPI0038596D14